MLQRFFIITTLLAVLLQVCGKTWVVVYYEWNKEFIAKNLCENRDKPELKCHGKCKLMKLMEKQREKEKYPLSNIFEKATDVFCENPQISIVSIPFEPFVMPKERQTFHYKDAYPKGIAFSFFHPPSI